MSDLNSLRAVYLRPREENGLWSWGCFIYILDSSSHFELVSSVLALEATEPVSEPVNQMAVELINNHLISVQQKR